MNNEFIKGVLDAKLSNLLNENDFLTFAGLSNAEKLNFFINNGLVSTSIVTNFEALCKNALNDLKKEIQSYLESDTLYVNYFFAKDYISRDIEALHLFYEDIYLKAKERDDTWLLFYLDLKFSLLNVLSITRAKKRGDDTSSIRNLYLWQSIMSEEVYISLINSDRSTLVSYVKNTFNIDLYDTDNNRVIEEKLDAYLFIKVKDLAIEGDLLPTLIYYIKMKKYEITRLRDIYYTGRNKAHG